MKTTLHPGTLLRAGALTALLACASSSEPTVGVSSLPLVIEPSDVSSPAITAALAATHATASSNAASDKQLNLLVRLYLDDGNMLGFYEPAPGTLLFIGLTVGGKTLDARVPGYKKLSAVDLFKALMPNAAVPPALAAAQQRSDTLGPPPPVTPRASRPASSPSESISSVTTPSTGGVKPLDCPVCTNWCDFACWQCRSCPTGDDYQWCYQDAYNGAWSDDNGNDEWGWGDICNDTGGTATLTISSDVFGGNFTAGYQQDAYAWTQQRSFCFPCNVCDENIHYSVSGSGIHVHFGGAFADHDCD